MSIELSKSDAFIIACALEAVTLAGGRGASGQLCDRIKTHFGVNTDLGNVMDRMLRAATINYIGDDLYMELRAQGKVK